MNTQRRAMVVDVEMDELLAVEAELRARGYLVLTTARFDNAALMARTFRPDVLVLSADLPGEQSFEILEQLAADARTAGLPVVMKGGAEEAAVRALLAGATAVVGRPIDALGLSLIDEAAELPRRALRLEEGERGLLVRLLKSIRAARFTGTLFAHATSSDGAARFEAGGFVEASFAGFLGEEALAAMVDGRLAAVEFTSERELASEEIEIEIEAATLVDEGPWDLAA